MLAALFALALALPATNQGARLELDAALRLDVRAIDASLPMTPSPPGRSLGGSGTFGLVLFAHPVVDNGDAPALQPFLQRVARFRLEGGGGGASIAFPIPIPSQSTMYAYRAFDGGGRADAQVDGYVKGWLYLAARLGFDYERWTPSAIGLSFGGFNPSTQLTPSVVQRLDSSEWTVNASAAVGVRWRELLVLAGWGVTPYRIGGDPMRVRFWGGAFVGVRAVVRRFVELDARVEVLDGGAAVDGAATVWLRRRLGLTAGAEGGHGALADSPVVYDRAGGHIGVAWWIGPRAAVSLSYAPAWQRATPVAGFGTAVSQFSFVAHLLTLTLTSRPTLKR